MIRDYVDEMKILENLSRLNEVKEEEKAYDEVSKGLERLIMTYHEDKMSFDEDFIDSYEKLKEAGIRDKDIISIMKVFQRVSAPHIKTAKEYKTGLKNQQDDIKQEIGRIAMENAESIHVTQRQLSFPKYGNVSVKLKKVATIDDEDKVIRALAQNKETRKYLKINKTDLNKLGTNKLLGIDGYVEEEKLTVTIK